MKNLIAVLVIALSLGACANVTDSLKKAAAAIEKGAGYVSPSVATLIAYGATWEAIDELVPSAQQAVVAKQVYYYATITQQMATGKPPTPDEYTSRLNKATGGDPLALKIAGKITKAYAGLYPQLAAAGPNSVALMQAVADGIKTGADAFLPPVIPAP